MRTATSPSVPVNVVVGLAAERGDGIAYATVQLPDRPRTIRVPFAHVPAAGLSGRDATYAAMSAVAVKLLDAGVPAVRFTIADDRLGADLLERRSLPSALTLPYVTLRCRLNRFASHSIEAASAGSVEEARIRDLTARARAELSLHVAA